MSLFVVLFKVIPYLMPFVKEMLIGKKSWSKAFQENRRKTMLALALVGSLVLNLILMTKVGLLAFDYLELSRTKLAIEHKFSVLQKSCDNWRVPVNTTVSRVAVKETIPTVPTKPRSMPAKPRVDSTVTIKEEFERMREHEDSEL